MSLLTLPDVVRDKLAGYLSLRDQAALVRTCKAARCLCLDLVAADKAVRWLDRLSDADALLASAKLRAGDRKRRRTIRHRQVKALREKAQRSSSPDRRCYFSDCNERGAFGSGVLSLCEKHHYIHGGCQSCGSMFDDTPVHCEVCDARLCGMGRVDSCQAEWISAGGFGIGLCKQCARYATVSDVVGTAEDNRGPK